MFRTVRATLFCTLVALAGLAGCGGGSPAKEASSNDGLPPAQVVASSISMAAAHRLAAAPDDSVWVAWAQQVPGGESVYAARVDAHGQVSMRAVTSSPEYARRNILIAMAGGAPVVAWIELDQNADRALKVAAWTGSAWMVEQTVVSIDAAVVGEVVQLIGEADGSAHLVWSEDKGLNGTRLRGMRRGANGVWETAQLIRTVPMGMHGKFHTIAADSAGSVMAAWTEEPDGGTPQPQELLASRFDPVQGTWGPSLQIDAASRFSLVRLASGRAGEWVVAFVDSATSPPSIWSMKYMSGTWQSQTSGVGVEFGMAPRELCLTADQNSANIAWIWEATAPGVFQHGVRAARMDLSGQGPAGYWARSAVSGVSSVPFGALHLSQGPGGRSAVAWSTASGNGDPWLALSDGSEAWAPAVRVEPPQWDGNGPDVVATSSGAWVVVWGRFNPQKVDLMARRFR